MKYLHIISQLEKNTGVFKALFEGVTKEEYEWKQAPEKWCMLEIICHLYDEEKEDFKTRLQYALIGSMDMPPSIDPVAWVTERQYMSRSFEESVEHFLVERSHSLYTLRHFKSPDWHNFFIHPNLGKMTAHMILSNWLAHDYLHMRQIIRLKYDYLKWISRESLSYAGEW
ncbi:MAG TPA: DinB family protein [Saprospiraceae bacterium]|nr:DinB family protein [Saprospiraceae bacterium]